MFELSWINGRPFSVEGFELPPQGICPRRQIWIWWPSAHNIRNINWMDCVFVLAVIFPPNMDAKLLWRNSSSWTALFRMYVLGSKQWALSKSFTYFCHDDCGRLPGGCWLNFQFWGALLTSFWGETGGGFIGTFIQVMD